MCDFTAASYRHGTVIEFLYPDGSRKPLRVSQARLVGLAIQDQLPNYLDAAQQHIRETISALGTEFGFTDPDITYDADKSLSSRFDPGLILDLPKIAVKASGRVIEFRTCITVCVGPTKSKVWTRANTVGDWDKISREDLDRLHSLFDTACKSINRDLIAKYREDFSRALDANVHLSSYGGIHVFAADCAGAEVSNNLESLCDRIRNRATRTKTIDDRDLAGAMRNVTDIAAIEEARDSSDTDEFALGEGAKLYPFRGNNGAAAVFVRFTRDREAHFTGIVNGDLSVRSTDYLAPDDSSNSVGTTAEIAAFFGSAF